MNTLVLLHAFPIGSRMWDTTVVPDGWQIVAPSLPGFDGTGLPPAHSTRLDDYADAVLRELDARGIDRFVACGTSMGGYVCFGLWREAAARCRGLVLADSRSGGDGDAARKARDQMVELVRRDGPDAVADAMMPKLLGPTSRRDRAELEGRLRRLIGSQSAEGIAAAIVRMRDRPDSTALLPAIHVPALVVVGEEDQLTPLPESEKMQAALPDATLVTIPGAGHLAPFERPDAFNVALASFLSRL
ncbi:MAG: alpha/beta fold hydrolase [Acidimicrobiia bacterium]|nr:alpha/beta fold hydrolase [Acidimicrobiia bacterium]